MLGGLGANGKGLDMPVKDRAYFADLVNTCFAQENNFMMNSLLERYKSFRQKLLPEKPGADLALNQTYLQLHQAKRQHRFIDVTMFGDDVVYQSMILALDPEEKTILVDELFPTGFTGMVGQRVRIGIRQAEGRKLTFNSMIMQQHQYDGSPVYVLAMPQEIESDQRRSAYRLPLGNGMAIESCFTGPDHQRYLARLCNLSSTGIAMEIESEDADGFHYDDQLTDVAFDFAGINIDCGLAVRNVMMKESDHQRVLIGAEFVDLPALEQRSLERSIMRIQRDRIKFSGQQEQQIAMA
jgi:c-di-GMP-binding flagellar brake protein YcgR